jgi:hemerythrin-like metal-binding protein
MSETSRHPGALDLGIGSLDLEHQGQLDHMEALEHAIESNRSIDEVTQLTEDLLQYLEAHFTSEQIAMRESAYPAYEDHVREHDEAITLVRELEAGVRSGDATPGPGVLHTLRRRLVEHVHTTDAALAAYLNRRERPTDD